MRMLNQVQTVNNSIRKTYMRIRQYQQQFFGHSVMSSLFIQNYNRLLKHSKLARVMLQTESKFMSLSTKKKIQTLQTKGNSNVASTKIHHSFRHFIEHIMGTATTTINLKHEFFIP
ncbi:hypothetical protein Droror1_Dr00021703 [Drosera rotundifolia]